MKRTNIKLGCIVIHSPFVLLFWLIVFYLIYQMFAGYVMLGPRLPMF